MDPIVDLDAFCGRHLTFRELIECGETWRKLSAEGRAPDNVPRSPDSLDALEALCVKVLDPLADVMGKPRLTYGFASSRLTSRIPGRIAPRLDQHAAHERTDDGGLICSRLGAAVDLAIPGVAASVVARWIASKTPFDRLYLYGDELPLHVSFGPEEARAVFFVERRADGVTFPRRFQL